MNAPLTADVARVVSEMVKGQPELDVALGNQVAGAIAKNFKVKPEEVAILRLAGQGQRLEFIVPEKLAKVGSLPMSSTSALAVRTARHGRAEFNNKFASAPHSIVFEGVPLGEESGGPIQKIVSVPIVVEGKTVGVIQISRKGKTRSAAGPDFAAKDVNELSQVATALVPCFPKR